MSKIKLKKINDFDLCAYKHLYETSFPDSEKKPFDFMLEKVKQNTMDMLKIMMDDQMIGLMITALSNPILLDYFAIDPKYQSNGYGSLALQALKDYYQCDFFGEIESTFNNQDVLKHKRKQFYIKNGMIAMPFTINLFSVDMEILTSGISITYNQYVELLVNNFGEYCRSHIKLL